jgi:hypothetical protein
MGKKRVTHDGDAMRIGGVGMMDSSGAQRIWWGLSILDNTSDPEATISKVSETFSEPVITHKDPVPMKRHLLTSQLHNLGSANSVYIDEDK